MVLICLLLPTPKFSFEQTGVFFGCVLSHLKVPWWWGRPYLLRQGRVDLFQDLKDACPGPDRLVRGCDQQLCQHCRGLGGAGRALLRPASGPVPKAHLGSDHCSPSPPPQTSLPEAVAVMLETERRLPCQLVMCRGLAHHLSSHASRLEAKALAHGPPSHPPS